ncbi:MAG: SDR family oxidoreductase [Clostridia bacterium]|nr:SDR family oxidoreductase [Clostridia bacterium]
MKSVLVTGGSGGIGSAICREFATRGYFVGVHYNSNKAKAESLANEIGGVALGFDLKNAEQTKTAIDDFVKKAGGISVLVNNAGVAQKIKPLIDTSEEEFDEVFSANVKGIFTATRSVLPYMLDKGGNVINVSSMWGLVGASCESVYSASKGAILAFTKSLAKEYASANIRVNAVAPGLIDTKMNDSLSNEDKKLAVEEIPLGRIGLSEEVAKTVVFLCEEGTFITGEVINVSGGNVII